MRFAILGTLEATSGGELAVLEGALSRRALAYLLVRPGQVISADDLSQCVYGGPAMKYKSNLQPLMSRIRGKLKDVDGNGDRIVNVGGGYTIRLERDELDAFVFEDLRDGAIEAMDQGDAATALARCDEALRLWRGNALDEFADEQFAVVRARQLEAYRIDTHMVRLEARLRLGEQPAEVVVDAEALAREAPDDERVLQSLMLAYYRAGRPAPAGNAFRQYRDRLAKRKAEPSAELTELNQAINRRDPVLDLPWPAKRGPVGESEHRGAPRTFLISAVEGSGRTEVASEVVARHHEIVTRVVGERDGRIFDPHGAHLSAVFERPLDALVAASEIARSLAGDATTASPAARARQAVHTGTADGSGDAFQGATVNRLRRMQAAGHPGQILVSVTTRELVKDDLPEELQVIGIGPYQFDDAARPERVYQLVHPGSNDRFPPLRTGRSPSGQRPRYTTPFLGREGEVADIVGWLGRAGLVTVAGNGGVGKTRLAVEVIERTSSAAQPGSVCFCDVSLTDDGETLVERLLLTREVRFDPDKNLRDQLIESLDDVDLLLVLDGCERLHHEVAQLVSDIRQAAAGVRILVTSRRRLKVPGELVLHLNPLGVPAPEDPQPDTAPAVQLLRDRAARSGVYIAPRDPDLAELARRLDGLPLAIELVGPMLNSFSAAELVERIAHCLEMPNDAPGVPRHQRTLRATFEWSYDLLREPARRLLNALSLFRGHWSLEMAEGVAAAVDVDGDDVMYLTTDLVDQALVRVEVPPGGTARYTMLDTLRAHATGRLELSGRYDDVADLHARYFLDLAERAAPYRGGPDEPTWVGQLLVEYDDFRVAFRRLVDTERVVDALRLVIALTQDLLMRERLEVGRWATELADHPGLADEPLRAEALGLAANAAMLRFQVHDAARLATLALAIEAETGATPSWTARNVMAMMTALETIPGRGWTDHLRVMEARGQTTGDPFPAALAQWDRGYVARHTGDLDRLASAAEALVTLGNAHDCLSIRSMGLLMRGRAAVDGGRPGEARAVLREALGAAEAAHTTLVVNQVRRELAVVGADNSEQALANLRQVVQTFADSGNISEQLQTALTIVQQLVAHGALLEATCALDVLGRTYLRRRATYRSLASLVHEHLTPAERAAATDRASRMQLEDLAKYLAAVVDELSIDEADEAGGSSGDEHGDSGDSGENGENGENGEQDEDEG